MAPIQQFNSFTSFVDSFKNKLRKLTNVNEEEAQDIKRHLDGDDKRVYEGRDTPDGVYSVTTILDEQDTPGKDNGIKYWKKANDGEGDNADWRHLLNYKTNRGTLAHYAAFNRFDHKFNHGDSMWTGDEAESQAEIDARVDDDEYIYSVMKDKGFVEDWEGYLLLKGNEDIDLQDVLTQDLKYVQEEFDKLCRRKGIKASSVEEVEAMFALPPGSDHEGFGGQADMLYEDPDTGEHVVADLKTSKSIYDKHKYQIAAYRQAAMEDPSLNGDYIDRCEIIRINPDNEEVQVYEVEEPEEYWEEFAELTRKAAD